MEVQDLTALGQEHLEIAREASQGRSATSVIGGHERAIRQTLIALRKDASIPEHENPGEAILQVLEGSVRLVSAGSSAQLEAGQLVSIPDERHSVEALADSVVLLCAAPPNRIS